MALKNNLHQGFLYCYIELFNTFKFIVLLDDQNYNEKVDFAYSWDLLKAKEVQKIPNINIIINPIMGFYNQDSIQENVKIHFDRFLRLIEQIKVKRHKIFRIPAAANVRQTAHRASIGGEAQCAASG
ncbi:MAG: hypothetical protein U5K79_07340 [Cyclobacteriaceae bacterium]|nr:hypothetical protein [Cyclobacteriaceae bacterium]